MSKLEEVLDTYPTITAIINTHNSDKVLELLPRAMDSILAQDYPNTWEVILVNDGKCRDDLVKLVQDKEYEKLFSERNIDFTFFGTEEESGYQCMPKNIATYHARGEYIAYLDYDNEWMPSHLSSLYTAIIEGNVWPDFTYCRRRYIVDEGCNPVIDLGNGNTITLENRDSMYVPWDDNAKRMLASSHLANFVDTSDMLIAKGAMWRMHLATGSMWNEGRRRFADWELITRGAFFAGLRGKGVDEVLTAYHWTGSNVQLTRGSNDVSVTKRVI